MSCDEITSSQRPAMACAVFQAGAILHFFIHVFCCHCRMTPACAATLTPGGASLVRASSQALPSMRGALRYSRAPCRWDCIAWSMNVRRRVTTQQCQPKSGELHEAGLHKPAPPAMPP